jgi:transposase
MATTRKTHSPNFKASVVLEILKGDKPLTQIAAEREVHPNLITKWRDAALKGLVQTFEKEDKSQEALQAAEARAAELYEQIGRLTLQVNWLKKKSGLEPDAR